MSSLLLRRGGWIFCAAGLFCAAVALVYFQLTTAFQPYDDEGYLISSLRSFTDGGALYDDVYTQYGPVYYLLFGAVYELLGATPGTDSGRFLTMAVWILAALIMGAAAWRLTERAAVAAAATLAAFGTLVLLVPEPMHPVGLSTVLLSGLTLAIVGTARHPRAGWAAVGVLVALVTLTKVNLGAFAVLGIVLALALADRGAAHRWWERAVLGAAVAFPALLLLPDLADRGAFNVLVVVWTGLGGILLVSVGTGRDRPGPAVWPSALRYGLPASLATAALVLGITVGLGSSVSAIWDGLVVEPSRLREVFVIAFMTPDAFPWWAAIALVLAASVRRGDAALLPGGGWGVLLRAIAGVALLASIAQVSPLSIGPASGAVPLGVLVVWMVLVPPAHRIPGRDELFVRAALASIAVFQALQVYPVAGTQIRAASMLLVVPAALILADAFSAFEHWRSTTRPQDVVLGSTVQRAGLALVAALALTIVVQPFIGFRHTWLNLTPLRTPGSDALRLPADRVAGYEALVATVRDSCGGLITLPGLNSLHLWSGVRQPTDLNAGTWMFLLDDEQQQRVVDALEGQERVCLVRNQKQLEGWSQGRPLPDGPLVEYVTTRFSGSEPFLGGEYELQRRDDGGTP